MYTGMVYQADGIIYLISDSYEACYAKTGLEIIVDVIQKEGLAGLARFGMRPTIKYICDDNSVNSVVGVISKEGLSGLVAAK